MIIDCKLFSNYCDGHTENLSQRKVIVDMNEKGSEPTTKIFRLRETFLWEPERNFLIKNQWRYILSLFESNYIIYYC